MAAGQEVIRVPTKRMARTRASARTAGKSDPIDALVVARAALREPDLPVARHDAASREINYCWTDATISSPTHTWAGCRANRRRSVSWPSSCSSRYIVDTERV